MQTIITFIREAWSELKQVTWLTVPQMLASTWLVVILVVILSLYIAGIDFVLKNIIGMFI